VGKIEEVRQLAEELGALKERKRQLDERIKELESKIGRKSGPNKGAGFQDAENQVLRIVDADPGRVFTVVDIGAVAPMLKASTIRVAFSRLRAAQRIQKVKHGAYQALSAVK
jgi:hypothetical protein